jgi:hypothetical protein
MYSKSWYFGDSESGKIEEGIESLDVHADIWKEV